ncbi:MAG: hypothetical protein PHD61_06805 [Bacteroidales bacterium]|nr:hypothetical protein [Lentimicrobiaceae bacterium]MDD5694998.1 hypothetical protein [Bacteroidales bacterium]
MTRLLEHNIIGSFIDWWFHMISQCAYFSCGEISVNFIDQSTPHFAHGIILNDPSGKFQLIFYFLFDFEVNIQQREEMFRHIIQPVADPETGEMIYPAQFKITPVITINLPR